MAPPVAWRAPDEGLFRAAFDGLTELFRGGALHKGVPATVRVGDYAWSPEIARRWLARAGFLRPNLYAYGLFDGERGVVGATPEVLFAYDAETLETMALAGTRSPRDGDAAALDRRPKDRFEHALVTDFLRDALAPFGDVRVGATRVEDYGALHHLLTPVRVRLATRPRFEDLVAALHPTPALGVSPRSDAGRAWLGAMEARRTRRRFGAPFGVRLATGEGKCWVAIRNVQFGRDELEIWAGCGVVPASRFETEWTEACAKIDAIQQTWDV
jgi:menaquinone-specific isochorismate synthase